MKKKVKPIKKSSKKYVRPLEQAAEKAGISLDKAFKIIGFKHEILNMTPKVVTLTVDLNDAIMKTMNKIAKELKIETEFVIGSILTERLKEDLVEKSK